MFKFVPKVNAPTHFIKEMMRYDALRDRAMMPMLTVAKNKVAIVVDNRAFTIKGHQECWDVATMRLSILNDDLSEV